MVKSYFFFFFCNAMQNLHWYSLTSTEGSLYSVDISMLAIQQYRYHNNHDMEKII